MSDEPRPEHEHDPEEEFDVSSFITPEPSSEAKPPEDEEPLFETSDEEDVIWPGEPEEPAGGGHAAEPEDVIWPGTPEQPAGTPGAHAEDVIWPGTPEEGKSERHEKDTEDVIWPGVPVETGAAAPGPEIKEKPSPPPPPPSPPRPHTPKWPFAVMAASLLVAGGTVGWEFLGKPAGPPETPKTQTPSTEQPKQPVAEKKESRPVEKGPTGLELVEQSLNAPKPNMEEALKQAKDLVESTSKSDDKATWRQAVMVLGDIQISMGRTEDARKTYTDALARAKDQKDEESEALFETGIETLDNPESAAPAGAEPKAPGPGPQGHLGTSALIAILVAFQAELPPPPEDIKPRIDRASSLATRFRDTRDNYRYLSSLARLYRRAGDSFRRLPNPNHAAAAQYFKAALDTFSDAVASPQINPIFRKFVAGQMKGVAKVLDDEVTALAQGLRNSDAKVTNLTTENGTLTADKTRLATENTNLKTDVANLKTGVANLTKENTNLKNEGNRLVAENKRLEGLLRGGGLERMTHGEKQWADFATRLASSLDIQPVNLPKQEERWSGQGNRDDATQGLMTSIQKRLGDTITGYKNRLAETTASYENRLAEVTRQAERNAYGEKQWAAFAQQLAVLAGYGKTLPDENARWIPYPETDAVTIPWMNGLGKLIADEVRSTAPLDYGERKWAEFADRVAKKVGYKPAIPTVRWARTPDPATERWMNDLAIFIPPPPPWKPPADQAVKEFNAGLEDYFHCRYARAVAEFDAAVAHAPHGDARFSYFRGLARLADYQTGGASRLDEAMQDLRHGIEQEAQEQPTSREIARSLTRVQDGLRQWLEVFRTTGNPPPGAPPSPPPCVPDGPVACVHGMGAGCACSGRPY